MAVRRCALQGVACTGWQGRQSSDRLQVCGQLLLRVSRRGQAAYLASQAAVLAVSILRAVAHSQLGCEAATTLRHNGIARQVGRNHGGGSRHRFPTLKIRMRLVVFSHKVCWRSAELPSGFATDGGFPFQMRALSELFESTTLVVPCARRADHSGEVALAGHNLTVAPLSLPIGAGFKRK